ncbi:MAG: hypothetical protein A2V99_04295, partial [Spirochaetes bacterium RBG_16_67_19]
MLGKSVMTKRSPFERLAATHPECEIWWDASPLVFENWSKQALAEEQPARRDLIETWHDRYYRPAEPGKQLFRGANTDLSRSWAAVQEEGWFWREWAFEWKRRDPRANAHGIWWRMYLEVLRRGAEKYLGAFHHSDCRFGYLSAQVDPHDGGNQRALERQAAEIASTASNLIAAVPATAQGLRAISLLTARGISTNAILCFTMRQFAAVADAVEEGLEKARSRRVDLSTWRSVVTASVSDYEEQGEFEKEGARIGIRLTEAERRWASIAVVKRAVRLLRERNFPGKLMVSSIRSGPVVEGRKRLWHLEKIAGADVIYACPGWLVQEAHALAEELEFAPA